MNSLGNVRFCGRTKAPSAAMETLAAGFGYKTIPRHGARHAMLMAAAALVAASALPAQAALTISKKPTHHVHCRSNVCTATEATANLNISDLVGMLASASTKVVSGATAGDIVIAAPLTWGSANALALDAYGSISVQDVVKVEGTASGLTLTTHDGASGMLSFGTSGHIDFWDLTSSLILDGASYTLVDDLSALKADIQVTPSGRYALSKSLILKKSYTASPLPDLFSGSFEGLGHTITGLTINDTKHTFVGLFAQATGTLRDIGLVNPNVSGTHVSNYVGALVGYTSVVGHTNPAAAISGAYAIGGSVTGGQSAATGGLVGYTDGTVSNSSASAAVNAVSGSVGGLVGGTQIGSILNSSASGAVTANAVSSPTSTSTTVGGLVGSFGDGTLQYSSASGNVTAYHAGTDVHSSFVSAGGLAGSAGPGTVQFDHATGSVTGTAARADVGGFVGDGGNIDQSYATGNVSATGTATSCGGFGGSAYVGGFIGLLDGGGSISNVYALGSVSGTANNGDECIAVVGGIAGAYGGISTSYAIGAPSGGADDCVGGVVGNSNGSTDSGLSDTYWDTTTSGVLVGVGPGCGASSGSNGLTDAQLKSGLPAGFDPSIWTWDVNGSINHGYPYLVAIPPS